MRLGGGLFLNSAIQVVTPAGEESKDEEKGRYRKLNDDAARGWYTRTHIKKPGCKYVSQAGNNTQHTREQPQPYC